MTRLLVASATIALMAIASPVQAQSSQAHPFAMFGSAAEARDPSVDGFYAARNGAPLWLRGGPKSADARALIQVLRRASVEGFAEGPAVASQAEALMVRAQTGDASALIAADRMLSNGWAHYVEFLHQRPAGMTFAEQWIAPRTASPREILLVAAAAPSLANHVRSVSAVNPFYSELRDAAYAQLQSSGAPADPRLLSSLERTRVFPSRGRYIVVDAASARLWMVEDGSITDSMKVIVGKPDSQTPMIASVIHYATLNPYWNVPPDMVRSLIARNVIDLGPDYLKTHGYEVLTGFEDNARVLTAGEVDWKAIAEGHSTVRVRQLPGPANSMGHLKFGFANDAGVYLHDTPKKELFGTDDRDLSHGCIRLEDAERLGRWLLGREPSTSSSAPEQQVLLPKPVPVYITYLTARVDNGQLTLVDDIYGRDREATMASLR
jgi:murein L,D-transpeptidase YcbB/YkuD